MKCIKCGVEISNDSKFCTHCGAEVTIKSEEGSKNSAASPSYSTIDNTQIYQSAQTEITLSKKLAKLFTNHNSNEVEAYTLNDKEIEQLSASFVSRDEKFIASLGNGYIMNYLANKSMRKGFSFVTDKRVYFKGTCLSGAGKRLMKSNEERIVDVKEITGSSFTYFSQIGLLITAFCLSLALIICSVIGIGVYVADGACEDSILIICLLFLAVAIPAIILSIKKFLTRPTFFRIEYAGGCIAFNVSYYAKAEINDFQKQLRRAKDLAEESAAKNTITESQVQIAAQSSVSDDLRKYADLLKEGLISQEEYDAMKKKILNL